jgi:hypothetical protein
MRSVFAVLRNTTEAEVTAWLDANYSRFSACEWASVGGNGPEVCIRFDPEFTSDLEPEERVDLIHRFGGEPAVVVMADISGKIPGHSQAFGFIERILSRFIGAAMDDWTDHLWTLQELRTGHLVSGHPFFDSNGWWNEEQA